MRFCCFLPTFRIENRVKRFARMTILVVVRLLVDNMVKNKIYSSLKNYLVPIKNNSIDGRINNKYNINIKKSITLFNKNSIAT